MGAGWVKKMLRFLRNPRKNSLGFVATVKHTYGGGGGLRPRRLSCGRAWQRKKSGILRNKAKNSFNINKGCRREDHCIRNAYQEFELELEHPMKAILKIVLVAVEIIASVWAMDMAFNMVNQPSDRSLWGGVVILVLVGSFWVYRYQVFKRRRARRAPLQVLNRKGREDV